MSMRRISAVFIKQIKDTLKNKTVLVNFILFPLMTYAMTELIGKGDGSPKAYFVIMFAAMYCGMVPLMNSASIIGEEKEKYTLRSLIMANVKPLEYLSGIAIYIVLATFLGSLAFAFIGRFTGIELVLFVLVMFLGTVVSYLLGSGIGIISQNLMSATTTALPFMLLFSFIPMFSSFNKTIEGFGQYTYTQQIYYLLNDLNPSNFTLDRFAIIGANMLIFTLFFIWAYKKSRLSE